MCINLHPDLDWRVLDVAADGTATFVGRLDGVDDLRSQAFGYAADYAAQSRLYHGGIRADPPILRPKPIQVIGGRLRVACDAQPETTAGPAEDRRERGHAFAQPMPQPPEGR